MVFGTLECCGVQGTLLACCGPHTPLQLVVFTFHSCLNICHALPATILPIAAKLSNALNKTWLVLPESYNQSQARAQCQQRGGELAAVDTLAEPDWVHTEMVGL